MTSTDLSLLVTIPEPWVLLMPRRDAQGVIVDFVYEQANEAACAFHHRRSNELIGASVIELHPNVVTSGLFDRYRDIVETGEPLVLLDWPYAQELQGGQLRHYDVRAVRANGGVSQLWVDVSDRHRTEERLAESEDRYRLLAENASDVVFRGSNEGVIEWVSPRCEALIGLKPEALIGHRFLELIHPDDTGLIRGWQTALLQGHAAKGPVRVRTATGDHHWAFISVKPVFDDNGDVIGRVGSWVDIDPIVQAQQAAEAERHRVEAVIDAMIDPFILLTAVRTATGEVIDLEYADANDAAVAYNLTTKAELIGKRVLEIYPGQLEDGPMRQYFHCIETGEPVILDDYAYANEVLGSERRYDIRATRANDGIALTWRDVTDRYRAVERLADSERRYRLLSDYVSDVIWEVSNEGLLTWVSDSSLAVLGWNPADLIGTTSLEYVHPDDRERLERDRTSAMSGADIQTEARVKTHAGTYRWMSIALRRVPTPTGIGRVASMHDIEAEMSARTALTQALGRDSLTSLMTRDHFESLLSETMAKDPARPMSLISVGIDDVSSINDAFTHRVGDIVVSTIAARVIETVGSADFVARGDSSDFLILLPNDVTGGFAARLSERIRTAAKSPIDISGRTIEPTVSIGVATTSGTDPVDCIRTAMVAMRQAKDTGRDRVTFATPDLATVAEHRLELIGNVAQALRNGELHSWFQPIADLIDGQVQGYESLVRWIMPTGELVPPIRFLPFIEQGPLIAELDALVLRQSIAALESMSPHLFVSVNISARSIGSDEYAQHLREIIEESGIDPTRLHLEVTETDLLDSSPATAERMRAIASTGARWYVDDFGTGYSSISHLRDLPISGLKLDVSFTRGIGAGDPNSITLAHALAGMAQGLGLDTVAEGVETEVERATLSAQGWRRGQGWLYGAAQALTPA